MTTPYRLSSAMAFLHRQGLRVFFSNLPELQEFLEWHQPFTLASWANEDGSRTTEMYLRHGDNQIGIVRCIWRKIA